MEKIGRNDRCPCGSGIKFKLCCGTVARVVAAPPMIVPIAAVAPPGDVVETTGPDRRCGPCTACCQGWAEGEIRGHRMFPGRPCHFLGSDGCTIYDERPQSPCRNFVCGWLQAGSPFPDAFRPDRTGVIVVPIRWHFRPAYLLLSAGRDPDDAMLAWMEAFTRRTGSPFYYQRDGERLGYGPTAFQQEMALKVARGEALW